MASYSHECPFCGANLDPGENATANRKKHKKRALIRAPHRLSLIITETEKKIKLFFEVRICVKYADMQDV